MTFSHRSNMDAIVIFFVGMILFTLGLAHQEIVGFESRFYLFALEMWRHGPAWFPTSYHVFYPDYPATSTFFIYLIASLMGQLNKLSAIFPSALAAAFTLVFTYKIGALHARRLGFYAVGFLLFTLAFLMEARTISLDMYVAVCSTASFYWAYAARLQQKSPPFFIFACLLILSFSVRGPLGVIIPAAVLSIFYAVEKEWKQLIQLGLLSGLVLGVGSMLLLLLAHHVGGESFMQQVMQMQVVGRLQSNETPAWYFYFKESIGAYALTYPLAIAILIGVASQVVQKKPVQEGRFLRLLVMWVLIVMIGMSIPADKKVRYILSIAPAWALICSYLLVIFPSTRYLQSLRKLFYFFCGCLPLLGMCGWFLLRAHHMVMNDTTVLILLGVIQCFILISRQRDVVFFLAVFSFYISYVFLVEPINLHVNQTKSFVEQVEKIRHHRQAKLVIYHEENDGWVIKYLINMPEEENPLFVKDLKQLPVPPVFILTSEEYFTELSSVDRRSVQKIAQGWIGRDKVVVFSKP